MYGTSVLEPADMTDKTMDDIIDKFLAAQQETLAGQAAQQLDDRDG
jgi:hypothetical protein